MNQGELFQIESSAAGKQYWKSLGELAGTPEFRDWVTREFPAGATELLDAPSRRGLLKLMAASFGLAGLTACRRPVENILPHAHGIENYVHGKPVYYATVMPLSGEASGLLVETHDARPTKIEGNPQHPVSQGAASTVQQAAILQLYDPDRSRTVLRDGRKSDWKEFAQSIPQSFDASQLGKGEGLRILSHRVNSPSLEMVRQHLVGRYPAARWVEYEPVQSIAAEAVPAFRAIPHFDRADLIVSFDSDFLGLDSLTVAPVKQFTRKRRITTPSDQLNRLYVIENRHSITGAAADHRLRARTTEIRDAARDLAIELGVLSGLQVLPNQPDRRRRFLAALAKDIKAHQGRCLFVAGPRQPIEIHSLTQALNQQFGAPDAVSYQAAEAPLLLRNLRELIGEMSTGKVNALVILGGNPVFDAPADLEFQANLQKVRMSVHLGEEANETAVVAKWHVPEAHFLESWGDARSTDGTLAIQQPTIAPLHDGKTKAEIVALISGYKDQKAYDIVRNYWQPQLGGEQGWRQALHDGIIKRGGAAQDGASQSGAAQSSTGVRPTSDRQALQLVFSGPPPATPNNLEVTFYPSASVYDGRFANNPWLQELPDPMTKLTWESAALISPATARSLSLADGDTVALKQGDRIIEVPILRQPGHADNSLSLTLGYGRYRCGRVGRGVGVNVYPFRTTLAFHYVRGVQLTKTQNTIKLATTQEHHSMEGRPLVRETTIEEYRKNPKVIEAMEDPHPPLVSLHREFDYTQGNQWGMAIDLTSCIGCNACMVACQAENNIPVVGKAQVLRGREMHWIRMDRYYAGSEDDPTTVMEPVPCMQCENAPCEVVCPVIATAHSPEGLNDMAYNRCVGTRYCSNNCPYKVRRFNFLNWHADIEERDTAKMAFNPDVSVRMRGVMEKCTYCVQRIQDVKIQAKAEGHRPIRDGEITPACAQTCPADAIVFGNINDPESRVTKLKAQDRNYAMLAELNVKPRTTYLGKVRNPNPELA